MLAGPVLPRTTASRGSSVPPVSGQGACCEVAAEGTALGWATALPVPSCSCPSIPSYRSPAPVPSGRPILPRAAREPQGPAVSPGKPWAFHTDPQGPKQCSQPALGAQIRVRNLDFRPQSPEAPGGRSLPRITQLGSGRARAHKDPLHTPSQPCLPPSRPDLPS